MTALNALRRLMLRLRDNVFSRNVESETIIKIIGRRVQKGSTIYTDSFKSYIGLGGAGYRH